MVSISFRIPAAHAMTMIPMPSQTVRRHSRSNSAAMDFFFGHNSWQSIVFYVIIAILSLLYNFAVFYLNFGEVHYAEGLFSEVTLLRLISCQWCLSFILAGLGIFFFHEVCLPVYVFIAILTTNGSAVLFAINARKVYDGMVEVDSEYFMILCFLFGASITHCIIYVYALHLQELNHSADNEIRNQHFFWDFLQFKHSEAPRAEFPTRNNKVIYSIV